jgi:DNA-binding NtrC family response regulator
MIPEKTPFKYAKNEFEKWKSPPPKQTEDEIDTKLNTKKNADELLKDFKFELQERAIKQYGSRKEAAKKLCVEEKTLNNWKNRKESQ